MQVLKNHSWWVFFVVIAVGGGWWFWGTQQAPAPVTIQAETGTVTSFVSVSGSATVEETIPLSFPRGGTVSGVFVSRGDSVTTGTILATTGETSAQAEYAAALAETTRARALRDEIANGQTTEQQAVTATLVARAEQALTNTIKTEASRVEAARVTLFSSGLSAIPNKPDSEAPAPLVSGSYLCTADGTYTIEPYRSGTQSGYSYRFAGIETGTGKASVNQPDSLGDCGLRLQFAPDASYGNVTYTITIPNPNSTLYATNKALYDQARATETANIEAAKLALALSTNEATVATAGARVEQLMAANASVAAAEARLAIVASQLRDTAIRAPRDGVITDVSAVVGQTVTSAPVLSLFSPTRVTFTARIPEKDITTLTLGQRAELQFDAQPTDTVPGRVSFISPTATTIAGAPFYEVIITLDTTPDWLRSGMQADVQIIITELTDVVRIPRTALSDGTIQINGTRNETITPVILLVGTDGYVAVEGISAGTVLILPTS